MQVDYFYFFLTTTGILFKRQIVFSFWSLLITWRRPIVFLVVFVFLIPARFNVTCFSAIVLVFVWCFSGR